MRRLFLLLFISVFVSCQQKQATEHHEPVIQVLTADIFANHIQNKEVQLIDVRTKKEFEEGHIKGARHHHVYDKDFTTQLQYLDKEKPVYIYCKAGGRSQEAAQELEKLGFKKIYDLEKGISTWNGEIEK